jgi:hypothetical protein
MQGRGIGFCFALGTGKRRGLPDAPEGRLHDLFETFKEHIRVTGGLTFQVIKQQFGFQNSPLRGMLKNRC